MGKTIPYVDEVNNLGFFLNSTLSCESHINHVVKKIYCGLRQLYISSAFVPVAIKLNLVRALFMPIINYGSVVFSNPDSSSFRKLELAFNSAIRYVYGLRKFDHISRFSCSITGCSLREHINIRNCIFLFNIIKTRQPAYLYEKLCFAQSNRTRNINVPHFNYLSSKRLFFFHAIRLWNSLPLTVRSCNSDSNFKKKILNYIRSNPNNNLFN